MVYMFCTISEQTPVASLYSTN